MVEPTAKKARTTPTYELLYHPTIPGRGEFIRLAFEAARVPYTDIANDPSNADVSAVYAACSATSTSSGSDNPPLFAPPILRVTSGSGSKPLMLGQTPNILSYLAPRLGLVPDETDDEAGAFYVQQLALTALDLNNEVHDTHHPIAVAQYYEDQKPEALKKAEDVRTNRLPKYFSYFSRALKHSTASKGGEGKHLVGGKLTYADTTVWQVLDGLFFAFPKEMKARKEEFPELLGEFYESVKAEEGIQAYLGSERRMKYGDGVFRHYPELDRQ